MTEATPATEVLPAKTTLPKQNGQTRAAPGSRTGLVWDYADEVVATRTAAGEAHVVPFFDEIYERYLLIPQARKATCQTQYASWVRYHGFQVQVKARRVAEKPAAVSKEDKKAIKEAEKAAKLEAKEAEKAAKLEAKEAEKEAKEAAKAAKQAKREATEVSTVPAAEPVGFSAADEAAWNEAATTPESELERAAREAAEASV